MSLCLALSAACSSSSSSERTYALKGQILSIAPDRLQATIKHEDIKGLMAAMTMPYKMKEATLLDGIAPGDLINATLVIVPDNAYLTELTKVGTAPLEQPPAEAPPAASSGFELLAPGQQVPNARFLDQDAKPRDFDSFRGSTVLITFIYTKCPLPTFCPLLDRHFATIQEALKTDASLKGVHLVSVSFDPITDTPAVLKAHADSLKADPSRWTFLTGQRDDIDQFAARFGVSIARAMNDQLDITHNLRAAVVDATGRLVKVYIGNEWTPAQVLADVKARG